MTIVANSRNLLTDVVQVTDAFGVLVRPPFVDLRERVTVFAPDDRFITINSALAWGGTGLVYLGNALFWWVIADLSDVVDPFTELQQLLQNGEQLRCPSSNRLLFSILAPSNTST
jgi:hypothetical protein